MKIILNQFYINFMGCKHISRVLFSGHTTYILCKPSAISGHTAYILCKASAIIRHTAYRMLRDGVVSHLCSRHGAHIFADGELLVGCFF